MLTHSAAVPHKRLFLTGQVLDLYWQQKGRPCLLVVLESPSPSLSGALVAALSGDERVEL